MGKELQFYQSLGLQGSLANSFLHDTLQLWIVQEFDVYLQDAMVNPNYTPQERRQLLVDWEQVNLHTWP